MGLIREPKNVDFTVLDKPWTDEERREFSAYIKMRKEQHKKRVKRLTSRKKVVSWKIYISQEFNASRHFS